MGGIPGENRGRLSVAAWAGALILLIPGLVLVGWTFRVPGLIRIIPSRVAMNPTTALCFLFLGGSLLLQAEESSEGNRWQGWVSLLLALLPFLAGALRLADYFGGTSFHVDRLLFPQELALQGPYRLDEMAPNTALNFVLVGLALGVRRGEKAEREVMAQVAVFAAGFISLLALIGYSYQELVLYRVGMAVPMALDTALVFALCCFGFLAARPQQGIMALLTSDTAGGALARRLLPVAVLVPWLLGALLLLGEEAGRFSPEFAISLSAVISIFVFTVLIWSQARMQYAAELDRRQTERRLAVQHQATRLLAECSNVQEALPKFLQVICQGLGWPFGAFWRVEPRAQGLRCQEIWYRAAHAGEALAEASTSPIPPNAPALPAQVWAKAEPQWRAYSSAEREDRRGARALKAGLQAGIGVPVWQGQQVIGVLEFCTQEAAEPDPEVLETLTGLATQLGLLLERTSADEQLRRTTANLQRSNTELQQFAYVASHDLFEPLRMVTSYLELLSQRCGHQLDPRGREFVAYALDGARRMDALIRDLLAYSRVDLRGRSPEAVDFERVLHEALGNLKVAIEESTATITHGPLPRVRGDSVQLTQVLQNLIGNAIKFRGTEPPRIEVTAEARDQEWVFRVRDNGIGIEPKQFDRLFVIFQRLHTRQEYAGTGMGLAICKKIIERHGGRIWVESAPGQGSTFLFTLPMVQE